MDILTVINPFNGHPPGAQIRDAAAIKEILAGEHAGHVVRTTVPDPVKERAAK